MLIVVVAVSSVIADSFTPPNSSWYDNVTAVRFVQQRSLHWPAPLVYSSSDYTNIKGSSRRELLPRLLSLLVESSSCGSS